MQTTAHQPLPPTYAQPPYPADAHRQSMSAASQQSMRPSTAQGGADPPEYQGRRGDYQFSLVIAQQPIRARMCGFGDKDRRPITPPPCVRVVVTDIRTGEEVPADKINAAFFLLTVDLWDEVASVEKNIVRSSGNTPAVSISTASTTSWPVPPERPVFSATQQGIPMYAHQQQYPGQMPGAPYGAPPPPPPAGQAGGSAAYGQQAQSPHPSMYQGAAAAAAAAAAAPGQAPAAYYQHQHHPSYPPSPPQQQQPPQPQYPGQPMPVQQPGYGHPPGYPPQSQQQAQQQLHQQSGSGMFTRNLIGSLAVNSFSLHDLESKIGHWFVLQDLSVRTEGCFRLKLSFIDVGTHDTPLSDSDNKLNHGKTSVLASVFSQPFTVFSAKKFPGVIESTPLSKCFAGQGIKIPIRKDGTRDSGVKDDDED